MILRSHGRLAAYVFVDTIAQVKVEDCVLIIVIGIDG